MFVFNLGQSIAGWARIKVRGKAGTKIVLRHSGMLNPDGTIYTDYLREARAVDTYYVRGAGEEVWEPSTTYHGFQYVELTGYPGRPPLDAVTGIVCHSDLPTQICARLRARCWRNVTDRPKKSSAARQVT